MNISEITQALKDGKLTAHALTSSYLEKINANKHLNAVIELNPDALKDAKNLDNSKDKSGELFGVPVLIKDNINTAGRMHTSAGSLALSNNIAPVDAPIVQKLRRAGAIILGKSNLTEFSNYISSNMKNGYSTLGGQTISAHNKDADTSGSSSGSAVAVSAGLCVCAVGTETYGSIISPSQNAGIVGIKPSDGLLIKDGIIPISHTLDTSGPMASCIDDARIMLSTLSGLDYRRPRDNDLSNMRIGIYRQNHAIMHKVVPPQWQEESEKLLTCLEKAGATLVELPEVQIPTDFVYDIMNYELKHAMNNYLSRCNNPNILQSLEDIIEFNRANEQAIKYGQDLFIKATDPSNQGLTDPNYLKAIDERNKAIESFDNVFKENKIDAIFATSGYFGIAAATGFASMTIPIGKTADNIPLGTSFMAQPFEEDVLIKIGYAVEELLG